VEEIHRDRTPLIEAAMGPSEADLVTPRFERGCRCFAVLIDGAVAGYGWLSTGPEWIGEIQLEIRPGKAEAYIWNCVTLAEHRRKGVFRSLVAGIADAARRSGAWRVWIGSVDIPAESALAPLGFRPALGFATVAAGPVHMTRMTVVAGQELGLQACAVLRVRTGTRLRRARSRRH
jgi:GNAT superfamily N-acetyltransferase